MIEVVVDDNLTIISTKQDLYTMLGEARTQTIATFLFDEDVIKIKSMLKMRECQLLTKIKTVEGVKDILIRKTNEDSSIEGRKIYKLFIIVINEIFDEYVWYEKKIKNLQTAIFLADRILFEYSKGDDYITISHGNDDIIYEGDLEGVNKELNEDYFLDLYNALVQEQEIIDIKKDNYSIKSNSYTYDYKKNIAGIIIKGSTASESNDRLDYVTGLYNKKTFIEHANKNINIDCGIAVLDIDYYKDVNYMYGHQFGDDAIKLVSDEIKSGIEGYGFAGRFGEDQFIMFFNTSDETVIRSVCEAIRLTVQTKTQMMATPITVSIGIARKPIDADTYDELFELADKALYIAKYKGRNKYIIYRDAMHKNIEKTIIDFDVSSLFVESYRIINSTKEKEEKILEVLNVIKEKLNYDQVNVYLDNKIKYSIGTKLNAEGVLCDSFLKLFNKKGILSINNTMPIMATNPIAYSLYEKQGIVGFVQVLIKRENDILGYISFELKKKNPRSFNKNEIEALYTIVEIIKEDLI